MMQTRVVEKNGTKEKQYLRVCLECGDTAWRIYRVNPSNLCKQCTINKRKHLDSYIGDDEAPRSTPEQDRAMIEAFLNKGGKVTTIEPKFKHDIEFRFESDYEQNDIVLAPLHDPKEDESDLMRPFFRDEGFDSIEEYYDYHEASKYKQKMLRHEMKLRKSLNMELVA